MLSHYPLASCYAFTIHSFFLFQHFPNAISSQPWHCWWNWILICANYGWYFFLPKSMVFSLPPPRDYISVFLFHFSINSWMQWVSMHIEFPGPYSMHIRIITKLDGSYKKFLYAYYCFHCDTHNACPKLIR